MRLPSYVTRNFYFKSSIYVGGQHGALDIATVGRPTTGDPLLLVGDGVCASNGWDSQSGWNVSFDVDEGGWRVGYRHLIRQSPVAVGTRLVKGSVVGHADSTGNVTGPHLHFDLWNKNKLSPEAFFKVGWWAHDPAIWLNKVDPVPPPPPPPQEDWFMATEADWERLRRTIQDELGGLNLRAGSAPNPSLADLMNVLHPTATRVGWANNIAGFEDRFIQAPHPQLGAMAIFVLLFRRIEGTPAEIKGSYHHIGQWGTYLLIGGNPDGSNIVGMTAQQLDDMDADLGKPFPKLWPS